MGLDFQLEERQTVLELHHVFALFLECDALMLQLGLWDACIGCGTCIFKLGLSCCAYLLEVAFSLSCERLGRVWSYLEIIEIRMLRAVRLLLSGHRGALVARKQTVKRMRQCPGDTGY